VGHVAAHKKAIVEREGVLEYYPLEETFADVADLAGLKAWLAKRTQFITSRDRAEQFGLSFPKGVLLVGVPGCGKSLCAKAVAVEWQLPLLRLDPGRLYNKYMGESEKNFRRAMDTAERLAPCVLFIDELEKAFASGGSEDGGVSQRVLGTFLSWMQERKADVFTVATANDVTRLPPEFLRKGRFDEVFFVDLPNDEARLAILAIHLKKRAQEVGRFDMPALVRATAGFSGAEIEQAIVSALYTVFAATGGLTSESLLAEIATTRPLSRTLAERVSALRDWARGRTVSAN
jgi:SpoVK/Ycf46/Vps4 family AAA+-type ATPase